MTKNLRALSFWASVAVLGSGAVLRAQQVPPNTTRADHHIALLRSFPDCSWLRYARCASSATRVVSVALRRSLSKKVLLIIDRGVSREVVLVGAVTNLLASFSAPSGGAFAQPHGSALLTALASAADGVPGPPKLIRAIASLGGGATRVVVWNSESGLGNAALVGNSPVGVRCLIPHSEPTLIAKQLLVVTPQIAYAAFGERGVAVVVPGGVRLFAEPATWNRWSTRVSAAGRRDDVKKVFRLDDPVVVSTLDRIRRVLPAVLAGAPLAKQKEAVADGMATGTHLRGPIKMCQDPMLWL